VEAILVMRKRQREYPQREHRIIAKEGNHFVNGVWV